jgi:hypothetical protein
MYKFNFEEQFLIFTHIPKCGGTSFNTWITNALNEKYLHVYKESFEDKDISNYVASGGHFNYGLNPFFNHDKNIVHISIMRHPFNRFISFYNYVKRDKNHYLYNYINHYKLTYLEFAKYLYHINNYEISNLQTKMLSFNCDKILWEDAFENIKKNYFLVGCIENIYNFYYKLSDFLNVDINLIPMCNVSYKENEYEYSDELKEFIYLTNIEDYKLYNALFYEK